MMDELPALEVKQLGLQDYETIWRQMQRFTEERDPHTPDQIWLLQHHPVYTQGQNGKPEHLLNPGQIPVIQVDRGGQITYHGPGQIIAYVLVDLRRLKIGVRDLVSAIENGTIAVLKEYNIHAHARKDAPGVYIDNHKKIASLGLRVRKGSSYHGLSFNIDMDLTPFKGINPCGLQEITMTQLADFVPNPDFAELNDKLGKHLQQQLTTNSSYFEA